MITDFCVCFRLGRSILNLKSSVQWKRWGGIACLFVLLLVCSGCAGFFQPVAGGQSVITTEEGPENEDTGESTKEDPQTEETTEQTEEKVIYVHICGCVKNPGLYTFSAGVRAGEAVTQAGGFTKEADTSAVNLAAVLEDGVQLYVPSVREEMTAGSVPGNGDMSVGKGAGSPDTGQTGQTGGTSGENVVNLNTAGMDELMTLSGIGESRAQAILTYREENGGFSSIEDIKNVSGIGEGIFERIKNMITV